MTTGKAPKRTPHPRRRGGPPAPASFAIVGIGASAGGLEAFEALFHHVPDNCTMSFVLVPHLDPDHASLLSEILQRATTLPVSEATNRQRLAPGHVYVIPPNRDMTLAGGMLRLAPPAAPHGQRMPIDDFLTSLAAERGRAAIGVVLSGTGSDGTRGLRAIVDGGGIALVQEPTSAKYDGMARNAIDAGVATRVLPPEDMPAALARLARAAQDGDALAPPPPGTPPMLNDGNAVNRILAALRTTTGHDFSQYKKNTVMRRITRRMTAQDTNDPEQYARVLRHDPGEVEALFRDLLINVTGFFRDADAFTALKEEALRPYLAGRSADFVFRAWVAGCAGGEEAYSIAIVLHELLEEAPVAWKVQLYATDLDEEAIEFARAVNAD